jgi:hypothetical protein
MFGFCFFACFRAMKKKGMAFNKHTAGRFKIAYCTMKFIYIIVLVLTLAACATTSPQQSRFTQAEIVALELDSTLQFRILTDSLITWNINPLLKKQPLRIDELIKSILYIPLETTEKSLVANIQDILVTDNHMYVVDSYKGGSVVIFDSIGRYVGRINRGPAPEEIRYVNGIAFDEKSNELMVYDGLFFSVFSPNGQFKRRVKTPFLAYVATPVPDGYLFRVPNRIGNNHLEFPVEYQIFLTDKKFRLKSAGLPYHYGEDNTYENPRSICYNDGRLLFTTKFTDTIYQYVDLYTVKAKYRLDYSSKKVPNHILMSSCAIFEKAREQNNYYLFMGGYAETSTHDFVSLTNDYIKNHTLIFRDKQSGHIKGGTSLEYQTNLLPLISAPIRSKGSYFIGYAWPEKKDIEYETSLISEKDKQMLKNLTEDSNPVLIFYELKPF